jgi:hypothetical protein
LGIAVAIFGCSSSSPSPGSLDSGSTLDSSTPSDAALDAPLAADAEAPDAGDAQANDAGNTADLQWYFTCGDPVCETPDASAMLTDADGGQCPTVGQSCSTLGDTCGTRTPAFDCGATEVCETHDPTASPNGCPMSSRQFKNDIQYLDGAELERLHDQVLRMRLASCHYKGQYACPNPKHLGCIVEDNPQSLAVDREHDRVDVYGYLSIGRRHDAGARKGDR